MWVHENQRRGMKRCTPLGYGLRVIADLLGFLSLLSLVVAVAMLAFAGINRAFRIELLVVPAAPLVVGILSRVLFLISWKLAERRGFEYDHERHEASWIRDGARVTYPSLDSDR
jgi:hypothetical protein